jgi:hypothetical protein
MPHPSYVLPRELSAALARIPQAAHYLTTWYQSGNPEQAISALRTAGTRALRHVGEDALSSQEREEVGRMLADLEKITSQKGQP